jgi:hypothetical protein
MKKMYSIIAATMLTIAAVTLDGRAQNVNDKNELTGFHASHNGNAIQLQWTALTESNIQFHEIQKSTNGSAFRGIGTLTGQNNTTPFRYTFLDATPVAGNNYYRLRTVDKTGNQTFSNIISVNNGAGKTDIRVLPNPVQRGVLNLQLANIDAGQYAISLYSNAGQKVFTRSLNLTNGSVTETINLPESLGHGLYFLQLTNGEMRINKQIIVQ